MSNCSDIFDEDDEQMSDVNEDDNIAATMGDVRRIEDQMTYVTHQVGAVHDTCNMSSRCIAFYSPSMCRRVRVMDASRSMKNRTC